jgi:hypothetical protein
VGEKRDSPHGGIVRARDGGKASETFIADFFRVFRCCPPWGGHSFLDEQSLEDAWQ